MPAISRGIKDIKNFKSLLTYFCDVLNWPIDPESSEEEITFDYDPEELGIIKSSESASITIKQLRPPASDWPWGIFYIDFSKNKLPVVLLRSILRQFVEKKRRQNPNQPVWKMSDLIFISFFGAGEEKGTSIVHFMQQEEGLPELKVISWDQHDTDRHIKAVEASLTQLGWPDDINNADAWRKQWESAFKLEHRYVVKTSPQLAIELARCAKRIKRHILSVLGVELEDGPLHKLYEDFKKVLIHDLTKDDFADMYAQTISYGLFSARCMDNDNNLHIWEIVGNIPDTNPFLKNLLSQCLNFQEGKDRQISMEDLGIYELVELLNDTDTTAIQDDFGREKPGEDPVIHLYEGFMKEYDKQQKVRRGEFYTPDSVVSYIVNSVDDLLKSDFGCSDGLADVSTWSKLVEEGKIKMPRGIRKNSKEWKELSRQPFVQILDPATGTGTFIKQVILKIYNNLMQKWRNEECNDVECRSRWNSYVPKNLLSRLYGFELKMAPYSVAHLKLTMILNDTGYEFKGHERLNVFLTNTLEPTHEYSGTLFAQFLSKEAKEANKVKSNNYITVIIGNPPYSVLSGNLSETARTIINPYKYVNGEKIKERSMLRLEMHLQDDYIKFLAYAQKKLSKSGTGLLGFITNNGYLDNLTLRGVRNQLMSQFESIWILNLHGGRNRRDRAAEEANDQNVFDIEQGVAILLGKVFASSKKMMPKVYYDDILGKREDKYHKLLQCKCNNNSVSLNPQNANYFFVPHDNSLLPEYEEYISLSTAMPVNISGIVTAHDGLVVDFEDENLVENARILRSTSIGDAECRKILRVKDNAGWKLEKARNVMRKSKGNQEFLNAYAYRPFDVRRIYYHPSLVWCDRKNVMAHILAGDNIALATCRQLAQLPWEHVFVTKYLQDDCYVSNRTRERSYHFPLYLYGAGKQRGAQLEMPFGSNQEAFNFSDSFIASFAVKIGIQRDGNQGFPKNISPKEIFCYIYGIFNSPNYRKRYIEFLKIDFPRIPLTRDIVLFQALSRIGKKLVNLHLMASLKLNENLAKFVGATNTEVEKISWSDNSVWINKDKSQGFHGISENIWNFRIGSYQVCQKWLKDRKGRKLSKDDIEHYQKIVVALNETIRLMAEIDKVIDKHGGWPIAFA